MYIVNCRSLFFSLVWQFYTEKLYGKTLCRAASVRNQNSIWKLSFIVDILLCIAFRKPPIKSCKLYEDNGMCKVHKLTLINCVRLFVNGRYLFGVFSLSFTVGYALINGAGRLTESSILWDCEIHTHYTSMALVTRYLIHTQQFSFRFMPKSLKHTKRNQIHLYPFRQAAAPTAKR